MTGAIEFEQTGAVGSVTISHPGRLNAMTRAMWRELRSVFEAVQASTSLRCVVVRGRDGHFCAGGDISEYAAFRFEEDSLRAFHEDEVWGGLQAMLACDVPLVAQIEGHCMGAGVEIASCCDIRIAGASARFGAPIARLGFPMAPREAALVMREAGALTARQMLLEAAVFDATQMHTRGFLSRILADDLVAADAQATAARVARLAPQAARRNKQTLRALNRGPDQYQSAQSAINSVAQVLSNAYTYASSDEHREGVIAFVDKREPRF
ncbi:enoyl-CoA hydratase/isomerase family protein [Rhodoferax sp.]|uniref:enoyl-CoA hydratase/isomerase family protein n=1 Tax=Rhodoferax sp. TaxID=50421 RepID=UPI0027495EEB|nr:enoyl-CoA hydratase/isomerase family protein [Rhodoferax sp.]